MSLQSKLESGKFAISCECGPLKGTDTHELKENIEILKGKVDAARQDFQQVLRFNPNFTSATDRLNQVLSGNFVPPAVAQVGQ